MKISLKSLCLAVPGVFLMGCGQAKKPPVAQTSSEQTPVPAAASPASGDASVASAAPADSAPGGGGGGPRQRGGGGGRGGADRGADRLQRMATALSLTPEQSEKIKAIMEAQRPAMDAIRNDNTLSREDRRAKMQELRKTSEPEIQAILTPEQKTKWEELRSQMANRPGGGGPGGGGNGGGGNQPAPPPSPAN